MILIIDDDPAIRSSLQLLLKRAGYQIKTVANPADAIAYVHTEIPQLILMDMNFSLKTTGEEGIQLLRQVKIFCPDTPIILMTAWGSISLAVQGMKYGAFDFVTKPWSNQALVNTIQTALQLSDKKESDRLTTESSTEVAFDKIIGRSTPLMEILNTVKRIAHTNASVLITGESGTGKELIAEALHCLSNRSNESFVKVNLGGISQSLFESEMFGHKKGAFTDASMDRVGRFELADRGTIFLDEIGDLDLSCQVKLLRVLQDQTFEVLGDSRPRKINVRVVSATNADLVAMVANRTFREDLFYRINLITVHLPPLRERREDIPLLARYFANKQTEQLGIPEVQFTPEAITFLQRLPYTGNIRELKNLIERTLLVNNKETLDCCDFETQYQQCAPSPTSAPLTTAGMTLDEIEKQTILQALEKHRGNLSHIAQTLGISRAALYRRLEKYNIVYNL